MTTNSAQVRTRVRFETVQALLAVGANPAIECAARVLTLRAIRVLVQLARQFAHEPAALGGTEPRTNGGGDDAVAEQRGGFGRLGGHGAGPPNGDGVIQSAPA